MPHARRRPRKRACSTVAGLASVIRELEELDAIRADVARGRDRLLAELQMEAFGRKDVLEEVAADVESVMGPNYPRGDGRILNPQYDQ